jgi:hypothetical protein
MKSITMILVQSNHPVFFPFAKAWEDPMRGASLSSGQSPKVTGGFTRICKAGFLGLASYLRNYLVAIIWLLVFWFGLNFLFGLAVGVGAGMHGGSDAESIKLGGLAAIRVSQQHSRLILFLSGFCVAMGMSSGRLLGARRGKAVEPRKLREQVMQIRRNALARIEHLKKLEAQAAARPVGRKSAVVGK